jgi:prevent-host-death family protein
MIDFSPVGRDRGGKVLASGGWPESPLNRQAIKIDRSNKKSYNSFMKKASITEAKNNFSALIDSLKSGSPVLIVDRGRPVARLEAVSGAQQGGEDGKLLRLVREGFVRPRRNALPRALLKTEPPHPGPGGPSAVDLLIEERREGR